MNIAVIGGGIAGLVAAWRLSQRHVVTLFERHAEPGFVASSVTVQGQRVDVPLRVFYPGYYPTLTRLYAELGLATEPVNYATTFTGADGRAYFRWRNLRWGSWSWPFVLPHDVMGQRARRIVRGALRFKARAAAALVRGELADVTLDAFVKAERIEPEFVDGLLLPAVATVATCTLADARAYPANVVANYAGAGLTRQSVHRVRDGADAVAMRLLAGIARVHCDAGVLSVRRERTSAGVRLRRQAGEEVFDHVVLATQANQALALLDDASAAEAAALKAFRYHALDVVMHRDAGLMPARRGDWSAVNACVEPSFERPQSTIWLNRVQPALRGLAPLFQTVMPQVMPRDELVVSRARFERPLVDAGTAAALVALQRLHAEPGRRVWLCGSYAQPGVPLLESAVRSAYAVADGIDAGPARAAGRVAESIA